MTTHRSQAPLQSDPIRARLGIRALARDVVCPNCGVTYATERRWQMSCPDCGHLWTDRSSRTLIDKLRDVRLEFFSTLLMAFAVVGMFGFLVVGAGGLFAEAAELRGWEPVYGLAIFFIACLGSLILLGWLFRKSSAGRE